MKTHLEKITACIMAISFSLLFASCDHSNATPGVTATNTPAQTTTAATAVQKTPSATVAQSTPPESLPTIAPVKDLWKSLPRIDGSTATIPLSEGITQALLGVSAADASKIIHHNTTDPAYENLIEGKADIIFVTEPSQDELKLAKDKGIELEVVPVVREGFVFLVNKDNPVNNLTIKQLQDIYQGKITNWKEVGGADEEIKAYQRPVNSGSQTLMLSLVMKTLSLMNAPGELTVSDMAGLIEAVSAFDTGKDAIGYSVYYYATDMYAREGAKLISVNGVFPEKKTISAQAYPFTSAYYAVLNKAAPRDGEARKLLAWVLSGEGQLVAEAAGYVPLKMK